MNVSPPSSYQELTITANTDNYIIDNGTTSYYFQVAGVAGDTLTIDWGDNTTSEIIFTGSDQRIAKTYANAGVYNVKIYGWENITRIRWQGWNAGAFNLQNLPSGLTYLRFINLGANITGSIDSLPSGVDYLYLNNLGTNLTGSIGSLNANITRIYIDDCGNNFDLVTNLKAFNSADITITPQSGYGYTTAQIDAFLNAYDLVAGSSVETIDLRGANQPRSSASDAAVASLTAKGRTILTNP